ncbi:MAG: GntR family transcriptional regulator [Marinibacterium sp.]
MDEIKIQAPVPETDVVEPPVHERVYRALRDRVLYGDLGPGQAVTIQGLATDLGAGITPVREAIRRMTADGGLVFQDNRRVVVPRLERADVEQLGFLRHHVEPELTRRACLKISLEEIDFLRRTDAALDAAIATGDVSAYLTCNHRFHDTICRAAGAPILAEAAARLWLRFGPSLRVVCGRFGTSNLPDRHQDILAALETRDPEAAARAMAGDIAQGLDQILAGLRDPVPPG